MNPSTARCDIHDLQFRSNDSDKETRLETEFIGRGCRTQRFSQEGGCGTHRRIGWWDENTNRTGGFKRCAVALFGEPARKAMADVLATFRREDVKESMDLIEAGGFDTLHFAYYKNLDIGSDGEWDVWQIEGPSVVWYFRGAPHVHTWVHIRKPA